jgi:uncharacterized protein involved in exopolysaccharide biosynthesis
LEEGRARAALAAAREHLAEQLTHYTQAHPDVRAAEAAVERAVQRLEAIQAAAPRVTIVAPAPPAATTKVRSAAPRAASTPAAQDPSKELGNDIIEIETQWLKLTRAVTVARQRHDQVETQLFRADILASSEGGGHGVQVNVIDPAFLPERPLPPGRLTIALMFLFVSGVIGVGVALVRATLDERVWSVSDAEGIAEILVEVPKASKQGSQYVAT